MKNLSGPCTIRRLRMLTPIGKRQLMPRTSAERGGVCGTWLRQKYKPTFILGAFEQSLRFRSTRSAWTQTYWLPRYPAIERRSRTCSTRETDVCRTRKAGHRSTLRSSVFAFWHRASVYVRLSAFCLRIYATTKVRPVCVYVFENNACVRK